MPFTQFIKRASSLLGIDYDSNNRKHPPIDGEIVFCKNNVCVHPPAVLSNQVQHFPGYLTIKSQDDQVLGTTLILTWIPNSNLENNPRTVENSPAHSGKNNRISPRRSPRQDFASEDYVSPEEPPPTTLGVTNVLDETEEYEYRLPSKEEVHAALADTWTSVTSYFKATSFDEKEKGEEKSETSETPRVSESTESDSGKCLKNPTKKRLKKSSSGSGSSQKSLSIEMEGEQLTVVSEEDVFENDSKAKVDKLKASFKLNLEGSNTPAIRIRSDSRSSTDTSGPDSPSSRSPICVHQFSFPDNSVTYQTSPPIDSPSSPASAVEKICGVFSVDLGQMRSLRFFFEDESSCSGQMVIASRESQYKVLHFHHGGLDKIRQTLSEFQFFAARINGDCRQLTVVRPHIEKHVHPEEGAYSKVNLDTWNQHMNEKGQIEDSYTLRKAVFFAGIDQSLRREMWPFLLSYYPYSSTFDEREQIRNEKYIEYQNIRKLREEMSEEEREAFTRNIQCIVEKDVVRTDRSHAYFRGEDNPNIEVLQNILLNYATLYPQYGYTQGMSDLLAPILAELQHESDSFWCFSGLMRNTIFVSSPKDVDMDKQLVYLRELLRIMLSSFYEHISKQSDGLDLLFCHRWILLCFKREFCEADALRMWQACWAHYQTDYFHLFICVAIIALYGEDVVQQNLPSDEILLHFSSLAMHMLAEAVLRKARAILHDFRTRSTIPCTLSGLCTLCGPGIWDSGHVPNIVCIGGPEHSH
ncbi:DgyrCDS11909 [Dimorphilus gyrociliatus]|uniref:DgyrCDS11909 n=1 Tax=Dimorphilus gyrociliatus TaxID=2664684 RepID=A0A7I8W5R7_9ANNE|nr:DgyrCDS11909 [Dimorphilus gyrociliatus]